MNALQSLPELGVGVIYMSSLHDWLAASSDLLAQIEVEPQSHWLRSSAAAGSRQRLDMPAFEAILALDKPCLMHSVGCPIGASDPGLDHQRELLAASVARLDPPWVSEHLSFLRFQGEHDDGDAGFLLPPLQSNASVHLAAANLRHLAAIVQRPVAFETGVNYLKPLPGELADGEFFAAIATEADCGILLDLHNLYANERNGRQPVAEVIAALPLERVIEVHIAGGEAYQGYWLDAHVGLCQPELMQLAADLLPRLPNLKALTFEMMDTSLLDGRLTLASFRAHLRELNALWQLRGSATGGSRKRTQPMSASPPHLPDPVRWERLLAGCLHREASDDPWSARLAADPGTGVLRDLLEAARAGTLVQALSLSLRLIEIAIGHEALVALLATYWRRRPPLPYATDEAARFADWVIALDLRIPALHDVLGFELACRRAYTDQRPQTARWHHHPDPVLEAIRDGQLPSTPALTRPIELTVCSTP